ncbi:NAD(P)H-dependent oxidoreductase [Denitrobaculum tricleocarpae]|uniref:NAD(P)H-dependent oxidoreductase n=1 Tax=Denitrobaculum tricleocarpae TaxID=2591009 RepID=A0A545TG36_9PROT|nr:NAD(P)H-dependent oxidoreductase [Denitrobaculum tricleocarpae]TQV76141.1 NAD(P)H-dependent oxidoreductase [Denitrobaculum tricleocarpae]
MRVLVLFAHPVETSFQAALHSRVVETLTSGGHEVDDCDLYAEGFDPRLTRAERLAYHDLTADRSPVQEYIDRLQAAQALVLVFPVWNFGYPAILKGFFDRVFLPGVAFRMENGKVRPSLGNLKRTAAVVTYGGSRMRAFLLGDAPRKQVTRVLRAQTLGTPQDYLALYDLNRASADKRAAFLQHIQAVMENFK